MTITTIDKGKANSAIMIKDDMADYEPDDDNDESEEGEGMVARVARKSRKMRNSMRKSYGAAKVAATNALRGE